MMKAGILSLTKRRVSAAPGIRRMLAQENSSIPLSVAPRACGKGRTRRSVPPPLSPGRRSTSARKSSYLLSREKNRSPWGTKEAASSMAFSFLEIGPSQWVTKILISALEAHLHLLGQDKPLELFSLTIQDLSLLDLDPPLGNCLEGEDDERDLPAHPLLADQPEKGAALFRNLPPEADERAPLDGEGVIGHNRPPIQLRGDEGHHRAGGSGPLSDQLVDHLLPCPGRTAGQGRVEVDHRVSSAHLRAQDEHVDDQP